MKKRVLALLLALLLCVGLLPAAALATSEEALEEPAEETDEKVSEEATVPLDGESYGTCGDDLAWSLEDGTLTISGTGVMTDYTAANAAPWYAERESITTVLIKSGVENIGSYAFSGCSSLSFVSIPESVESMGEYAFSGCVSLGTVTIPSSVTVINQAAFSNCRALTSIVIPDEVTSIEYGAFSSCTALESVTIGSRVETIGTRAFHDCTALETVTMSAGVTDIGRGAFKGCTALVGITLPSSVTTIRSEAFAECASLTAVTIPSGVTSIAEEAFRDCTALAAIVVDANNANYCSVDGVVFSKDKTTLCCCPAGMEQTNYSIPSSVTSIGHSAFRGCSSLEDITIPSNVTTIEVAAFYGCSSIRSIDIPSSVTLIENYAFYGCTSLKSFAFPAGVTDIRSDMFSGCTALESVTIPAGVTVIGNGAFSGCTALTDVYYAGTAASWAEIRDDGNNECLKTATLHTATVAEVLNGLGSDATAEDIRETVQGLGADALADALSGEGSAEVLRKLNELEGNTNTNVTVTGAEDAGLSGVSIVGAALNTLAEDATDITLTIDTAEARELPEELSTDDAVYINITLVGVEHSHELAVPVVLTFAVPEAMAARNVRLVHYTEGDPEVLEPIWVVEDADGVRHVSFVVGGFSPFALAQLAYTPGDFTGDGEVTILDVLALLKSVAGISSITGNGDVNNDGYVTILDVLHLLKYVAGILTEL